MSQTDKEARLANKARDVEPEATGESESLSTKVETPETTEPSPTPEPSPETAATSSEESDEDRANREHDEALRTQYDRVHAVAAAGGDNGLNEVE